MDKKRVLYFGNEHDILNVFLNNVVLKDSLDWEFISLVVDKSIKEEYYDALSFLSRHGYMHNYDCTRLLSCAISSRKLKMVKFILAFIQENREYDLTRDSYILAHAVSDGGLEIVKFLYDSGFDSESSVRFALQVACAKGFLEILNFLYLQRRGGGEHIKHFITAAAINGRYEVVEFILRNSTPSVSNINGALASAIIPGHLQIVKLLHKCGGAIPVIDACSKSLITCCVSIDTIKYVLSFNLPVIHELRGYPVVNRVMDETIEIIALLKLGHHCGCFGAIDDFIIQEIAAFTCPLLSVVFRKKLIRFDSIFAWRNRKN